MASHQADTANVPDTISPAFKLSTLPLRGFQYSEPSAAQTLPQQQTTSSPKEYESEKDEVMASSIPTIPYRFVLQPSAGPKFKNMAEHGYFMIFLESAALQLSGCHESSPWDHIIPQACYNEPWAMSAVIAIGAFHRYAQSDRDNTTADSKGHYIFALHAYGDAIAKFKRAGPHQLESGLRLILIFTLLATCFETYIGNNEYAITQAETGVAVLLKWAAGRQKEPTGETDETDEWSNVRHVASRSCLEDDLVDAFQRLDYQVLLCRGLQPGRKAPQAFPSSRHPFVSVNEAERFCDRVMRRVLHSYAIKNIREQHSPSCYDELHEFRTAIKQFFRSFGYIFLISRRVPGSKNQLLANILMIRALACRWAISQGPSDSEMYTDGFLRDYNLVNSLASELITRKVNFNFDMTLGASLFSLSHHCRNPTVRRAAIDLLHQCTERAGWFDTLVAAKISKWLMDKEELRMVDSFIPDPPRLRLIKHVPGQHKRTADLYCSELTGKDGNARREVLHSITF